MEAERSGYSHTIRVCVSLEDWKGCAQSCYCYIGCLVLQSWTAKAVELETTYIRKSVVTCNVGMVVLELFIIDDYEVLSPTAVEQVFASDKSSETVPASTIAGKNPVVRGLCGVCVCVCLCVTGGPVSGHFLFYSILSFPCVCVCVCVCV